jgi:hypothetical protein
MPSTRRTRARAAAAATTTTTTTNTNDDFDRAQINAANNAELRENAQNIHDSIEASRPKNTTLTYAPKQAQFQVRNLT